MKSSYLLSLSVMVLLSGCTASHPDSGTFIPSPKDVGNMLFSKKSSPEDLIGKSQDKVLTKAFTDTKLAKVTSIDASESMLTIESKRLYETDSFIYLSKSRAFYRDKAPDFLNDDIAKTYFEAIKSRGNGYIIYNGQANKSIIEAYVGGELRQNTKYEIYMFDSDFAVIEYAKDGTKVSALLRQARIEPSQLGSAMGHNDPAVTIHQNAFVLFASALKKAELGLNSTLLQNNIYKKVGLEEPTSNNSTAKSATPVESSKADKIKELHELYKAGALSEEEFNNEKKKILNSPQPSTAQSQAPQNHFEAAMLQKLNQQNGTNFKTMKEMQEYAISKQKQ